ncbi:DUF423 domain-containing protein [Pelistega sp. NLN82]|uniref:DUF423 domain-containing protein n=1 Tax=Pelistega ratti TaxID=2652177 RepID=A0A6L9Y5G5_9BURK|nr:DUF423 domain-containing protein [Pelistega ratti]NEN75068.1 DUF423 domain-containing protein [Pelistega ratti]
MIRFAIIFAALSGLITVALGAFGMHALKEVVSPERLSTWQTAVFYQFIHTIAIMGIIALSHHLSPLWKKSILLFILGILCFSGSLYTLVLADGIGKFALITPMGGLCFIFGWLCLALSALPVKPNA